MRLDTQLQFAQNIKLLRLHKSMSQLEMAKVFNLSRASYALYESGSRLPDMITLIEMADFFGVKTDTLLNADDKTLISNVYFYSAMTKIEHELLRTFALLSDYAKGKLLEKAYILYEEENVYLNGLEK